MKMDKALTEDAPIPDSSGRVAFNLGKLPRKQDLFLRRVRVSKEERRDPLLHGRARRESVMMEFFCQRVRLLPGGVGLRRVIVDLQHSTNDEDAQPRLRICGLGPRQVLS